MRKTTKIATGIYARERTRQLIKLAVGAGAYSSSPVWGGKGNSPASNPASVSSGPKSTLSPIPALGGGSPGGRRLDAHERHAARPSVFIPKMLNSAANSVGSALWNNGGKQTLDMAGQAGAGMWNNGGKQTWDLAGQAGTGIWNNGGEQVFNYGGKQLLGAGMNTLGGISTAGTGAASLGAGLIGNIIAGAGYGLGAATDAAGVTNNAKDWVHDNIFRHTNSALQRGVMDIGGGVADIATGGYYDYDGSQVLEPGQHKGTAVQQQRSAIRDELGRGSDLDNVFQTTTGVSNVASDMAAFGGAGRGLNVAAKALQGSSAAAPVLGAVASAPVVGKPLAAAGNWMAGQAPAANMFAKTPAQYYRAALSGADGGRASAGSLLQQFGDDASNIYYNMNPEDRPAEYAAMQQQQQALEIGQQLNSLQNQANRADNTDYEMSRQMLHDPAIQHRIQRGALPVAAATQLVQQRGAVPEEQQAGHIAALSQNVSQGGQFNVPDQGQPQPGAADTPAPEAPKSWMQQAGDQVSKGWESLTNQFLPKDARPEDHAAAAQAADSLKETAATTPGVPEAVANPAGKEAQPFVAKGEQIHAQQMQQQIAQASPPPTDPGGYGEWLSDTQAQISKSWGDLGPMGQLAVGLGVPLGLIGMLSGNIGGFLMGVLGLGAAGMAGAAGGVFGPDAQRGMGQMIDYGAQALGMNVPQGPQDMSRLIGADAVGNIQKQVAEKANPSFLDMFNIATKSEARTKRQDELKTELANVDSVQQLAGMPEQLAIPFIMAKHQGPDGQQASQEVARQIYQNALATSQQLSDPESEMAKQVATGRQYAADPDAYINSQVQPYKDKAVELANWAYDKYQNWGK